MTTIISTRQQVKQKPNISTYITNGTPKHFPSLVLDQEFKVTVGNPGTQEWEAPCIGVPVTSLCESYPFPLSPQILENGY